MSAPVFGLAGAPLPDFGSGATNTEVLSGQSGLASLSFGTNVLRFRSNPNKIQWTYDLTTNVQETYGGRVVQILGARLGDLTVTVECGNGGWPYLMRIVRFMNDMLNWQRTGATAQFEYTTRNWLLNVFAMSVPFQDQYNATVREVTLQFKIQEDVSGIQTSVSLSNELNRLQDGIGWAPSPFNQPSTADSGLTVETMPIAPDILNAIPDTSIGGVPSARSIIGSQLNYGAATLQENSGIFGGLLGGLSSSISTGDPGASLEELGK